MEHTPEVAEGSEKQLERCIEIFENYCIVSQSIKQGIPFTVTVNW